MRIQEYLDARGRSPFLRWFDALDAQAAAKITVALTRLENGNLGSLKRLSAGLFELRLDFGPGYRVYLGREGDQLIILLGGGTKRRQQDDIDAAQERWADHCARRTS